MALEQSGQLLPAEQRAVAMSTRAAKGEGALQTAGDLDRAWWQDAREHAFDARSVEALRGRGQAVDVAEPEPGDELERRIVHRLTEFDATFAQREARWRRPPVTWSLTGLWCCSSGCVSAARSWSWWTVGRPRAHTAGASGRRSPQPGR